MATATLSPASLDAVVFDLDGVITDTAQVHRIAWKHMFDEFLAEIDDAQAPFSVDDYLRYVDGRPRYDGVATFLAARGIELEWGDPADPPQRRTVCGLGNRKNAAFLGVLSDGVEVFDTSVALVDALRTAGIRVAIMSSSRNAERVLEVAGLRDLFDVVVDGRVAAAEGLPGKPDPTMFLVAAARVGAEPGRAAVVEDAVAGVEAGRRGDFRLVIGVDRDANAQALSAAGADVVVRDLAELVVDRTS